MPIPRRQNDRPVTNRTEPRGSTRSRTARQTGGGAKAGQDGEQDGHKKAPSKHGGFSGWAVIKGFFFWGYIRRFPCLDSEELTFASHSQSFPQRVLIGLLIARLLLALANFSLVTLVSADLLWAAVVKSDWTNAGMVLLDAVSRDGLVVPFVGPFVGWAGGFALDIAVCVWGGWVWKGKWQRPYQ